MVIWLTGESGVGKTTIANLLALRIQLEWGADVTVLDGDELRTWLSRDLGFSREDRIENVRRAIDLAGLVVQNGRIAIVSMISPHEGVRHVAKDFLGAIIVRVRCSLAVRASRDPKGLYAKNTNFGEYEESESYDIVIDTESQPPSAVVESLLLSLSRNR